MRQESNIIKFPGNRLESGTSYDKSDDEFDDFEAWELIVELQEKKDYPGLVKYCKQRAERFPDDPSAQYYLGEAYVLNGEYEQAIAFLSPSHRKHPDNTDFQHVILDALFALGKNESDFGWTRKPVILRMSPDVLNTCYAFLNPTRRPRSLIEIYTEFVSKGYLLFTEEDLLKALLADRRFIVDNASDILFAQVRVARKSSKKR
jgi:tetratricopeptide (TPR) repeat protein